MSRICRGDEVRDFTFNRKIFPWRKLYRLSYREIVSRDTSHASETFPLSRETRDQVIPPIRPWLIQPWESIWCSLRQDRTYLSIRIPCVCFTSILELFWLRYRLFAESQVERYLLSTGHIILAFPRTSVYFFVSCLGISRAKHLCPRWWIRGRVYGNNNNYYSIPRSTRLVSR